MKLLYLLEINALKHIKIITDEKQEDKLLTSLIEFLCHVTFAFQVNKRHKWSLSPLILTELNNECSTVKQQKFRTIIFAAIYFLPS